MKRVFLVLFVCLSFLMISCASSGVSRIDAETETDLSGYWNDTDVRLIADTLVTECVDAPAILNFIKDNGRAPIVVLGSFKNLSDEHLDTSILAKKFEIALVNSGKVEFIASKGDRELLREEREEQQEWADEDSAKSLANEDAADFMLLGSVKTIVDSAKGESVRSYIVNAELIDVEKNKKVWLGENSDIKKMIKRSATRW